MAKHKAAEVPRPDLRARVMPQPQGSMSAHAWAWVKANELWQPGLVVSVVPHGRVVDINVVARQPPEGTVEVVAR
jgi:hypothetical protein